MFNYFTVLAVLYGRHTANHRLAVWHIMAVNPVGRHFSWTLGRHCARRSGRSAFRHGANKQSVQFLVIDIIAVTRYQTRLKFFYFTCHSTLVWDVSGTYGTTIYCKKSQLEQKLIHKLPCFTKDEYFHIRRLHQQVDKIISLEQH